MKKTFLTYADKNFRKSAKRLKNEAKSIGMFDEIIVSTPKKLPNAVKNHPVFAFSKGGGYWIWKAYIIHETLLKMNFGDILCYSDAGSVLYANSKWNEYIDLLSKKDGVFFQYQNKKYDWGYPNLELWIKNNTLSYFNTINTNDDWYKQPKFWAGLFFIKKTPNTLSFFDDWYKIMSLKPELLVDEFGVEKQNKFNQCIEHRHDQAILSSMLLTYRDLNFEHIPEDSEDKRKGQFVWAARLKDKPKEPIGKTIRDFTKKLIGINTYKKFKSIIKRNA